MIKFTYITLFPEVITPYLETSMMWKAKERGLVDFEFVNLREFGVGPHKSVDDTPYGGGDGMLFRCEPAVSAIESVKKLDENAIILLPTPAGIMWDQQIARGLSVGDFSFLDGGVLRKMSVKKLDEYSLHYVIFCPKYEGVDERIMDYIDLPICVGNYVLTGGELPALLITDSVVRLVDGVLGGEKSAEIESFSDGDNLEFPQWTKPYDWRGKKVPDILLSGNHGEIAKWRNEQALRRREEVAKRYGFY